MNDTGSVDAVPETLARRIKRAARSAALSQVWAVGAVSLLIAGIGAVLVFDRPESMGALLFWLASFTALLVYFVRDAWKSLEFHFHPERSPEAAYLRRFGPLEATVAAVERELLEPEAFKLGKDAAVTKNWLVLTRGASLAVRRLDDLLWAYPQAQTTKLNGVIPIWTTHSAEFRFDGAPDATIELSQKYVAALLARVAADRPAIFVGYDLEVANLWGSEPARLAAIVKARRSKTA